MKKFSISKKISVAISLMVLLLAGENYFAHAQELPRVVLVGDYGEIPSYWLQKMPTGYSRIQKEELQVQEIDTPNTDNPYALYTLLEIWDEKGDFIGTDVDAVLKWAEEMGKEVVYFRLPQWPDADTPYDGTNPYLDNIKALIQDPGGVLQSIKDTMRFPSLIEEAEASTIPGAQCTTGQTLLTGGTVSFSCVDDNPGDGKTPGGLVTFHYTSKQCHFNQLIVHLRNNLCKWDIDDHASGGPSSVADCMKAHNGVNNIYYLVDAEIHMHLQQISPSFTAAWPTGCGSSSYWACAGVPNGGNYTFPLKAEGQLMHLTQDKTRNNLWLPRHELLHNYNFEHPDYGGDNCTGGNNVLNARHCCRQHIVH